MTYDLDQIVVALFISMALLALIWDDSDFV